MIARIWCGRTRSEKYEEYTKFLKKVAVPDYQQTVGFMGLSFLSNIKNNVGHFQLITYWESLAVIRNFAGDDIEKAKYYPEDQAYLLDFPEKVQHFEVFAQEDLLHG